MVLTDSSLLHRPSPRPSAEIASPSPRRSPLSGLLRLHGNDIARIQQFLDPLLAAGLFSLFETNDLLVRQQLLVPGWLWVLLFTALILPRAHLYKSCRERQLFSLARRLISQWCVVLTSLLVLTYLTKTTAVFSRFNTTLWAVVTLALFLLEHVGLRLLLRWHRTRGGNYRTILYWGTAEAAAALQAQLQENAWMGWRLEAWFSPEPIAAKQQPAALPTCGGGLRDMRLWLASRHVDQVIFSHVEGSSLTMAHLLQFFGDTCLPVVYAPHWALTGMRFRARRIGEIHCVDLWGHETSMIDQKMKRSFDLALTSIGLVLISPLLLTIAIAIALTSPGPILFAQARYGLDGRRFRIYKFRTMHVMEAGDQQGLRQACRHDARVTPLGRFLRRWSLDELPQLFNVIRGDMSLVGPRPHAVDHNEQYRSLIPGYMQRHAFKPGMTGLAQIEGLRGETSELCAMVNRVEADLRY